MGATGSNDADAMPDPEPNKKEKPPPPEWGGLTKEEVMNAAKEDSLVDDWTCVKGPPMANDRLPGLRYGPSIEMRPLTMLNPCPCAGGVWTPPHADDGAELDAGGLWHFPQDRYPRSAINGMPEPKLTLLEHPPPFAPDFSPKGDGAKTPGGVPSPLGGPLPGTATHPTGASVPGSQLAVNATAAISSFDAPPVRKADARARGRQSLDAAWADARAGGAHLPGSPRSHHFTGDSFMSADAVPDKYFPGSEPYSIDYGCASPFSTGLAAKPGLRWRENPPWTALAVATPCPCALGTFSTFNPPAASRTPRPPDSVFVTPGLGALSQTGAAPWQGNSHTMLGNMGLSSAVLALASSVLLGTSTPQQAYRNQEARRRTRSAPCQRKQSQAPVSFSAFL